MILYGDYHTHTKYTHGKGTVEQNVQSARDKGLKQIAITEHGFDHNIYGITRGQYNLIRIEAVQMNEKYKDIQVLCGIEANLLNPNGDIDIELRERKAFDVLVVGFHKGTRIGGIKNFFQFFVPNVLGIGRHSKKVIARNTQSYIKAIKKYKIDILAHLKANGCIVDPVAIARVAKEYDTYIELNGKRINFTPAEIEGMVETGVKFIISSDAHRPERVGENHEGMNIIEKYHIPLSQVVNVDKLPKFKFENIDK